MLDALLLFILVILIVKYVKSCAHPKNFPPGPKYPLPIIGHGYLLNKKINESLQSLSSKYGSIFGMWLFGKRAVIIKDFEVIQSVLKKSECSSRGTSAIGGIINHSHDFKSIPMTNFLCRNGKRRFKFWSNTRCTVFKWNHMD